jgi:hypothetical protein
MLRQLDPDMGSPDATSPLVIVDAVLAGEKLSEPLEKDDPLALHLCASSVKYRASIGVPIQRLIKLLNDAGEGVVKYCTEARETPGVAGIKADIPLHVLENGVRH